MAVVEAETLPSQSLGDGIGLPGDCVSKEWLSSGSLRKLLLGWRRNTNISKAQRRDLSCKLFLANTLRKGGQRPTVGCWLQQMANSPSSYVFSGRPLSGKLGVIQGAQP